MPSFLAGAIRAAAPSPRQSPGRLGRSVWVGCITGVSLTSGGYFVNSFEGYVITGTLHVVLTAAHHTQHLPAGVHGGERVSYKDAFTV